jgi:hypothetical protein
MPNIDSFEARICRSYWHSFELPRHLYHFSPSSLRRLCISAGLSEIQLDTVQGTYFEYSLGYLLDDICSRIGLPRPPVTTRRRPGFLWRAVRKANRLTMLRLIGKLASACGRGPDLRAIFQR